MKPLVLVLSAHVFSMLGFSSYAVSLVSLKELWVLSNTEAGAIASGFFIGYMLAVPMWTAMTDRRDARQVYAMGCLASAAASLGFGLSAQGFVSGLAWQMLLGAGVAATYMPGLRILTLIFTGKEQSRGVSFYTAFFGVGAALSLLLSGLALQALGWQWAMGLPALGPLLALLLMRLAAPDSIWSQTLPSPSMAKVSSSGLHWQMLFPISAWRRACQSRAVVGYAFGYGVHCMELFGSRAWTVAFLVFAMAQPGSGHWPFTAAAIAAFVNLISVPSSIVGNEIALRLGRQPWIRGVMVATTLFSLVLSLSAGFGFAWWVTVICLGIYSMLTMADSATLTAGFVQAAPEEVKGAAMGLYSLLGFGAGAVGPAVFGAVLDLAGGATQPPAWALAYLAIGLGCLVYPFAQRRLFAAQPVAG
ncbi:MAG: MFS transporter [Burkholderiaceae bacterium]|jgi:MFS family permease